jgi:hydroxyacylglutathione hydrolase
MHFEVLTFNPFQENTYIIWDDAGQAAIIDPGCSTAAERAELDLCISANGLTPVRLLNTHCHVDHVLGNGHVERTYGLPLWMHRAEVPVHAAVPEYSRMWGLEAHDIGTPAHFLAHADVVTVGTLRLQVLHTPGHSPGSITFYEPASGHALVGDVLFQGSIGRTDLPGGDMSTLISSIINRLMPLPDSVLVHPGHGPSTSIGHERRTNPFLLHYGR